MASVTAVNNLGGHAHNPRGNLWYNDDSTYGHKLLMKMGWTKGKGLGKKEDGIKENLKVKFRNTNSGLGFKNDAYANVMKTEYESILKNLAAEYSCPRMTNIKEDNTNSSEEPVQKSKVVKSKLRYPKMFFGKDVTKYSEKDMKSIFICSNPLKSIEEKSEKPVKSDEKKVENESPSTTFHNYSSNLSISDYFAKKMEAKKKNVNNSDDMAVPQETSLELKNSDSSILTVNENFVSERWLKDPQACFEKDTINIEESNHAMGTEIFPSSCKKSSRKKKKKSENNSAELNSGFKDSQADIEEVSSNTEELNHIATEINSVETKMLGLCNKNLKKRKKKSKINHTEINSSENELNSNSRKNDNSNSNGTADYLSISLEPKDYNFSSLTIDADLASKTMQNDPQADIEKMSANTEESNHVTIEICDKETENFILSNKKSSKKRKRKSEIKGAELNSSETELVSNNIEKDAWKSALCKNISFSNSIKHTEEIRNENSRPNKKRKISQTSEGDFVASSEIKCSPTKSKKKKNRNATVQSCSENSGCQIEHTPREIPQEANNLSESDETRLPNSKNSLKKKKSKRKLKEKLKSCLKNRSGSYSLKNVSFNESVSYRIIDSLIESVDPLTSSESSEENTLSSNLTESNQNNPNGDAYSEGETTSAETNCDDNIHAKEPDVASEESDEEYKLSDLPSSKSSHYNAWIESQRQAIKMQLYKEMLKSIKHHKILKTTNLLHVKGYGNWGYQ